MKLQFSCTKLSDRKPWFEIVDQVKGQTDSFIASHNKKARLFAWTKSKVHQERLNPCFAIQ